MDNLEEMNKFLKKYNFPKLNQEEIENLNRPITSTEIETVIRNLQFLAPSEFQRFATYLKPFLNYRFSGLKIKPVKQ